ncbi:MAG: hypothetical protein CL607_15710 [Anaerolineaceae bacterium]|nr:hypothetical protein [Anaerolineaceae bacterium]
MMLLMLVSGLFRRFHGWEHLRSGREPRVHTYYLGDSILRHAGTLFPRALGFTRSHWVGHLLINPIFCVILGILVAVSGDSDVVAIYFIVGGFLMMFKNQQLWELVVNMVLNEYDATLSRHKRPQIIASERQHSIRSIPVSSALFDVWSQIDTMEVDTNE